MDLNTNLNNIFRIKLDINDYSLLALNDMVRMAIIQIVVQILFFLRHDNVELFSAVFLENTLFIVMGVFIYWIIFNNLVIFTNKTDDKKLDINDYYQNVYNLS
jgi:hypothetical protein|tara:strand:- start:42 stop:350 length:309 start_codon:yes stop_codon:yes gene_type:complete